MTRRTNILLMVLVAVGVTSCGPKVIYEGKQSVREEGWSYHDSLAFPMAVVDTTMPYDLLLFLEHNAAFSYENLYVRIGTTFPDGRYVSQNLSLELTDAADAWVGNCRGEYCTVEIPIAQNRRFRQAGKHTISLAQHSRKADLQGVKSLRLRLQESGIE